MKARAAEHSPPPLIDGIPFIIDRSEERSSHPSEEELSVIAATLYLLEEQAGSATTWGAAARIQSVERKQ